MTMEMVAAPQGHTMLATRGPLTFTAEQRQMIRDSFANGASDAEFAVLMAVAEARNLNPLLRQIHFVARWDRQKSREVWSTQVSIDGLRAIAQRTGLYAGQDEPEFVENADGSLKCCKVKVYRKDWDRPAVGVAYWSEYIQTTRDKATGKQVPSSFWSRMPHTMLAKCAESLAIRKAFPEDTSGLYTPEEMGQADNDRLEVEEPQPTPRRARVQQHEPAPRELPAQLPDDAQRAADTQRAANDQRTTPTLPAPAEPEGVTVADVEIQVCRCGTVDQLADLWMALRDDVRGWSKADQGRAWKLVGLRAQAIGASAGAVSAEVKRRDTPTPPNGPGGGTPKPAADAPADAQGSAAEDAPAQGPVALVPPWCSDVAAMERHIEGYAHPLAIERCARKHRTGLPRAARELLALRYQRLSWDPHDGEITLESARELVERWIARGPQESRGRREARAKIAAVGGAR